MRRSALLFFLFILAISCAKPSKQAQKTFPTPEDAVVAMVDAARSGNTPELKAIFGPDGEKILSSGDPAADQLSIQAFLAAYDENSQLMEENGKRTLLIGKEEWPFPIPLINDGKNWLFDTAAGANEVLFRRIGRNELSTIDVCMAYVDAQKEYAKKSHDGVAAGTYAQKFASTPGKQDGLYWKTDKPEDVSPLGELAADAASEGYRRSEDKLMPFHGYYYRILTAQGNNANGGPKNYLKNGEMRGGFALIAIPAEHGNSGVMTFMVNQDAVVYEKDLGSETTRLADAITVFDPDPTWDKAQ